MNSTSLMILFLTKLEKFIKELELFVQSKAINLDRPNRTYHISDDLKGEKLIQLADLIAGSAGRFIAQVMQVIVWRKFSIYYIQDFQFNISPTSQIMKLKRLRKTEKKTF